MTNYYCNNDYFAFVNAEAARMSRRVRDEDTKADKPPEGMTALEYEAELKKRYSENEED